MATQGRSIIRRSLPSTSEERGVLPGLESGGSTEMPPKEPTIPSEESKQVLTLTIDCITVDVRWEDNDAVSELLDDVKDAHTSSDDVGKNRRNAGKKQGLTQMHPFA